MVMRNIVFELKCLPVLFYFVVINVVITCIMEKWRWCTSICCSLWLCNFCHSVAGLL